MQGIANHTNTNTLQSKIERKNSLLCMVSWVRWMMQAFPRDVFTKVRGSGWPCERNRKITNHYNLRALGMTWNDQCYVQRKGEMNKPQYVDIKTRITHNSTQIWRVWKAWHDEHGKIQTRNSHEIFRNRKRNDIVGTCAEGNKRHNPPNNPYGIWGTIILVNHNYM